ncbi:MULTISPECIES: nucleotidyltransferase family protein [unclassified Novosphingobium]|uniref:nucleotidyltransferase domain-containing protein n=1 Tax=unclassified Novosphingobium TaxID=2644732 RepID=UPI000EC3BE21|nr:MULTISPECIES: nucleotidyltransferase family protein [unclassified Novosphingobium]HCF25099.1 hypothetical protein [Novosphingobium sp.]HQV02283.1 nucleotidyltransferase family protein [Novosphingobium sp.]
MPAPINPDLPRLDRLKLWLIGVMLARPGEVLADPGFAAEDWDMIARCAGQHRLRPLLYHRLRDSWADWAMPDALRVNWHAAYKRAALRALDRQAVTVDVTRTLEAAGIAAAVLKGGALARHYGSAALRPMRDIDVLVAPAEAQQAFALLVKSGLVARAEVSGSVHVDYATHKHLEALWCPRRRVAVEVHTALVDQPRGRREDDVLLQVEALLGGRRSEDVGGHPVPVLGWAETMLHLIVHAVYDHQLNNGPLVLSDCAVLATDPEADWARFWEIADRAGRGAGARLAFGIIEAFAPQLPAAALPGGENPDPATVEGSALLMLQDTGQADAQGGWDRLFALGSWRRRLRLVRDRAALRSRAAEHHHHHGDSGNLTLAWRMLRALADPVQRRDISRSRAVFGWLQER